MPTRISRISEVREKLLRDRWPKKRTLDKDLLGYVEGIINEVRERGDKALIDLTEKFDGVKLDVNGLKVRREEIEEAYSKVNEKQILAIESMKKRVYKFERSLLSKMCFEYVDDLGVKILWRPQPIESVGCYVPGGRFPYPSTLVMTTVPAKAAGVSRVVVCTPPLKTGNVHPITLITADICGVDEIYKVGGAQAIAAMAYGTESIKPVNKIVGPGNKYVMVAKLLVSRDVSIDHPAGPSEIMILADETANPYHIALDLASQLEHGPGSIAILIALSSDLAGSVHEKLVHLVEDAQLNGDIWLLVADGVDEAISFINSFAPEHLEIITKDPYEMAAKIRSAGLILVGDSTPVSISDYCLGTNHVIPTGGYGHVYQSLSALDFIKFVSIVECPPKALKSLSNIAVTLAESEGLIKHALAISERVKGWL